MSATEAKKAADRRYKDETAIEGVSVAQYILSCHAEHIAKKDKGQYRNE